MITASGGTATTGSGLGSHDLRLGAGHEVRFTSTWRAIAAANTWATNIAGYRSDDHTDDTAVARRSRRRR